MDELEKRDKAISELIKRNKELKASGVVTSTGGEGGSEMGTKGRREDKRGVRERMRGE